MKISSFVTESTYGNVDSTNSKFDECLVENTVWAIKRGMTVLYPTFALGRHQEVLYKIKQIKEKELIPKETLVVVDGKASQIYNTRFQYSDLGIKLEMKKFMPKYCKCIPRDLTKKFVRNEIIKNNDPKIIVAPGGMCDYGAASVYTKKFISDPNVMIHGVGYAAPNSVMYKLLNTLQGETVSCYGDTYIKKCMTKITAEVTSHGPRDILLRFINDFPNTMSVSINHGGLITQKWFRKSVLENTKLLENQVDICSPEKGVVIEAEGITGTFNTKFATSC